MVYRVLHAIYEPEMCKKHTRADEIIKEEELRVSP